MEKDELKKYYEKYLKDTKKLSNSTINHYCDALNTISRLLKGNDMVEDSIYDIESVSELESLVNYISNNDEYKGLNERGNNMYSAGLNHFYNFVNGNSFTGLKHEINTLDILIERKKKIVRVNKYIDRSNIIRKQVIESSEHKCEYDNSHISFIQQSDNLQYMEGHHIIPLKYQDKFEYSLDVYANVISLCPNCHRKLHFGIKSEIKEMLMKFYSERVERYVNSGIAISANDFFEIILSN